MKSKKSIFASVPYLIWMAIFILVPLVMVLFFAFSSREGGFTFDNILGIGKYAHVFLKSINLSVVATLICLILAFPIACLLYTSRCV